MCAGCWGDSSQLEHMRNDCSCPPNLTFMPQISAWIPMCCGGVGQGSALSVIPDFSPLLFFHFCLGSFESFLLSCPWLSLGFAEWDLALKQHKQQATIQQLHDLKAEQTQQQKPREIVAQWVWDGLCWAAPSPCSLQSSEGVTARDKSPEHENNPRTKVPHPKSLAWERSASGFQGWPVPAELGSGFPSAALSLLYGSDSQHGKH